jgi:signal transduction histidine kinase
VRGLSGVTTLACDRDTLWAGGSDGLVRIRNRRIDLKLDTRAGMPDNAVAALSSTPDGSLWIGSDDGVSRWRNGELSVYGTRDGLSHSVVLSVFVDREGTLWTGTKDGLDQFTDPKFTPYSKTEGLSSNEVGPVMQDRAGLLWIGTLDHGIDIFDGRRFRNINLRSGLLSNRVLALAEDTDGSVWAGTDEGVNRITAGLVEKAAWDRGKSVRALSSDAAGTLWIATSQGVDRLAKGVLRHENDSAVFGFVPETPPGIANNSRPISCFLRGGEGSIWMGTLGSGLVRWRNGAVARMHVKDGLYDNRIYQLLRDDRANIWMASSKGIFRIAESELNAFADGKVRSVTSIPFTTGQLRFECRSGVQPAAWRTRDGRLWFATTTGLVVIDPNHLVTNTVQPPAQITSLFVDGERTPLHEVSIQPWQKNLEIRYAGLSFLLPEKVTFRYLLDGYDKRWVDAGARREAFYSNLPPGHFRFRVRARNADGVWGEEAAALAFTVQPRVYQRWWFWPALTALAGLAIYLGYRRRVRRLQRTFSLLLAERGRIARELHDTLLQGIAGVTMQLQALWNRMPAGNDKRVLREILEDASRCAAEARQSLWGLRAPSASARFSARMGQVCREAVAGTRLGLELALDETAAAPPEIEYQLLRIAQEAIANAVHHAEADHLRVRLKAADGGLTLSVTDDGRGFSTTTDFSSMGHFGLVGMRERAAEIGAELTISSGASGTIVCARVRYPESGQHSPEGSKQAKESAYEPSHTNPVG